MVNTKKNSHVEYLDQVISPMKLSHSEERAPGPSFKLQASSPKLHKHQAASIKPQAASFKRQAASCKLSDS